MSYDALAGDSRPERVFPHGHALYALARPSFQTVRRAMRGHLVSAIWMDVTYFPERAYRPSYDDKYGPGSVNVMPFIAVWLSSGPGAESPDRNVVLLPAGIDRTLVQYAVDVGLLGPHEFVSSLADFRAVIDRSGRKLYSIDDMGPDFEPDVVIPSKLSDLLNSKDSLTQVSAYAPRELIKDMHTVTVADYRELKGEGRVYLKTCNTEAAGAGVFVCSSEAEFEQHLSAIQASQREHDLSPTLVIQTELTGTNRSFQVFLDPTEPDVLQVIALTDQLVEDDGKTYRGSVNYPITPETLAHVGPAIVDMVDRVRQSYPDAFGILMCDFFETSSGQVTIYDPGIRPTGNTATALAFHFARELTGRADPYVSNIHLRSGADGLTFADFVAQSGDLTDLEAIARTGRGLLPWGWNDVVGFGVLIGVAPDKAAFEELSREVLARSYVASKA